MPCQSVGPVAALAIGTVTPLALTLYPREPEALVAGVVLAGALVSMTFNPSGPPPKAYDKAVEQRAIQGGGTKEKVDPHEGNPRYQKRQKSHKNEGPTTFPSSK